MFEQERFIGRLQRHAQSDPSVLVCFLHGSFGRRAEDAYSDVDITLVYAGQTERENAWRGRQEFVKAPSEDLREAREPRERGTPSRERASLR